MAPTPTPYWMLLALLAMGPSVYVPIGSRSHHDLERLVALADVPVVKKPYGLTLAAVHASRIIATHPELYRRITDAAEAPDRRAFVLQEVTLEGGTWSERPAGYHQPLPNERGRTVNGAVAARARALLRLGSRARLSVDAALRRRGDAYHVDFPNSYLSVGWPWLQADVGFRDHWLSPADDSAVALSTHAISSPSITIANALPLTKASICYELIYSRPESTGRIWHDGQFHEGRPRLLGLHLSAAPWSWLVIGGNRMMQFGGGPREPVSVGDVLRAFLFPNRYDNARDESDRSGDFGNQIGSLVFAANHRIGGMPVRLYWEMGADDTSSQRIVFFGNPLATVGVFLPCLGRETSVRYEFSEGQNRWYEHAIYQDGYRNDGRIMGHWMYEANRERWPYETEARSHSLRLVNTTAAYELAATLRAVSPRSFSGIDYTTGFEADLAYRQALRANLDVLLRFYTGMTPRREGFAMLSFGLSLH